MEIWFSRNGSWEGALVREKGEREWSVQGCAQEEHIPKAIGLGERLVFVSSCNQRGLETGVLKPVD